MRQHVLLQRNIASREEAIRTIGAAMAAAGDVTPRYVEGMLEKERLHGTWITDGVALPHGTNDVKTEILESSLVVLQMPAGVDWSEGRKVYLAFGLAGKGDDHLHLLAGLAGVLERRELIDLMIHTTDKKEILDIVQEVCG